jgi:hypothetical protein
MVRSYGIWLWIVGMGGTEHNGIYSMKFADQIKIQIVYI